MRAQSKGIRHAYAFDSLRELSNWIEATPRTWPYKDSQYERSSKSWDLNTPYAKAMDLARQGWIEGAQRAQAKLKALSLQQPAPRERNDFYGYRPHVPRYCAGAPDCMIRHENTTGAGQALTLYVNIGATASQDAECMANYGVAVAQYIKQLELEGTPCEVHLISTARVLTEYCTVTCKVKSAGQPLDLAVMAFAIGHPAMLRRIVFAVRERSACVPSPGYGTSQECAIADAIGAAPNAIVVNGMTRANDIAGTPEQALQALAQEIDSKKKG